MSGVYKITCTGNSKIYIGSTKNFYTRFKNHLEMLKAGRHHSSYLQNCYNKYGKESLQFHILEWCDNLFEREQHWIDTLNPSLNMTKTVVHQNKYVKKHRTQKPKKEPLPIVYYYPPESVMPPMQYVSVPTKEELKRLTN